MRVEDSSTVEQRVSTLEGEVLGIQDDIKTVKEALIGTIQGKEGIIQQMIALTKAVNDMVGRVAKVEIWQSGKDSFSAGIHWSAKLFWVIFSGAIGALILGIVQLVFGKKP